MSQASYRAPELPEYAGNPVELALPPLADVKEMTRLLLRLPRYSEAERTHAKHIRLHYLDRLFDILHPQPEHVELAMAISRLIRHGYKSRNPLAPAHARHAHALATQDFDKIVSPSSYAKCRSALYLVGLSGLGKSTATLRILEAYDQVITHETFNGMPFLQTQVTWLFVNCPHNASPKQLLLSIAEALDELLGTDYAEQYVRRRIGDEVLVGAIARNLHNFHVGLLVIDELQNLTIAPKSGEEKVLNLLLNLINKLGLPILLIGTNESASIFSNTFRNARRVSFKGSMIFDRYAADDRRWRNLIDTLWHYQWTRDPVALTSEMRATLHEASQGVIDVAIGSYMLLQDRAITTDKETFDIADVRDLVPKYLPILQAPLDALRRGDLKAYEQFRELMPPVDRWRLAISAMESESSAEKIMDEVERQMKERLAAGHPDAPAEDASKDESASLGAVTPQSAGEAQSTARSAPRDMPELEKRTLKMRGKRT